MYKPFSFLVGYMDKEKLYWEIVQRNFGVYSREEQKKIRSAKIAIVGIGCNGGIAAYAMARMGIGTLNLIDSDVNETSNLNRQPMATYSTIGMKKVEAAKKIIAELNPTVAVNAIDARVDENNAESLIAGNNAVLQCMDNMPSRIILHRAAKNLGIPTITMTGQPKFRSFVSTMMPDGPLYEELFGLDFVKGRKIGQNKALIKKIQKLKIERVKEALNKGVSKEWYTEFLEKKAGWGITPERAYLTGMLQVHEAIRVVLGKPPLAVAPKAIVADLANPPHLVSVQEPPNGKSWDFREF